MLDYADLMPSTEYRFSAIHASQTPDPPVDLLHMRLSRWPDDPRPTEQYPICLRDQVQTILNCSR